jgi:uncharacterized protein YqcC (DUF446 family)|tara:strand:- start:1362 stop:1685 length:324 start_codon:yes stop_codon:yes gene_type:complete
MANKYHRLADVLLALEVELRRQQLWAMERPNDELLNSIQPFCVDTLSFQQWLQFIFLPRMKDIIESGQQLPSCCDIAPMAAESFELIKQQTDTVVNLLIECDQIIST